MVDAEFDVAVCLPEGDDLKILASGMRRAAEAAIRHVSLDTNSPNIKLRYVGEPCASQGQWSPRLGDPDVLVGPVCSLHAQQLFERGVGSLSAVISPTADLPSLGLLAKRAGIHFARVSGDGGWLGKETAHLIQDIGQPCVVISNAASRWWGEVGKVLTSKLRETDLHLIDINAADVSSRLAQTVRRFEDPFVVCCLDTAAESLKAVVDLIASRKSLTGVFAGTNAQELTSVLEKTSNVPDGRIYTVRLQAPEISPEGHSHLRWVRAEVSEGLLSGYASQTYDAVLAAASVISLGSATGRPASQYGSALRSVDLEGSSGRIRFDGNGDRRDQGECHLAIFREGAFRPLRQGVNDSFDALQLHPAVRRVSQRLFYDGHYFQAISESFKLIDQEVKRVSGISDKYGPDLMAHAFNEASPPIQLNDLKTTSDRDEQKGFQFLFMGSMTGIRNPYQHELGVEMDPLETLEYLAFASLLMRRIDRRTSPV